VGNHVWVSPQGHRSVSVSCHFLLQAPQCPCSVQKRFSRDHCCQGTSKPGCRIVGSHTRWELTTWTDFQLCLHRLLMSALCKSSHSGFLDVSRRNGGLRIGTENYVHVFKRQKSVVNTLIDLWLRTMMVWEKLRDLTTAAPRVLDSFKSIFLINWPTVV